MRRRRSTDGGGSARHPASAPALALRVCRGGLVADVQRDRLQPRLLRCARLDSTTQRIQSRGHSPRTILYGRPTSSFHRRRAGVEARPYGGCLRRLTGNVVSPHRRYTNPSVTAQSAATAPLSGEPRGGRRCSPLRICLPRCAYRGFPPARKGQRPRRPAFARPPGWVGRGRLAWPAAPAFPTVRPPCFHHPTYHIPRAQPAQLWRDAPDRRYPSSRAGRAWKVSPYGLCEHAKKDRSEDRSFCVLKRPEAFGAIR